MNHMSAMVQIRNVPDEIHRELKARAALAGVSLSDYILGELRRAVARPTRAEVLQRLEALPPLKTRRNSAAMVRAERGK
jgi:antitoxin FitA